MRGWIWIAAAVVAMLPGVGLVLFTHFDADNPLAAAVILGIAVIGAAFLLSWAVEVAQLDVPAALALSVLALIAVLPEYSVDFALTLKAGSDETYRQFAVANMIGANRVIVGIAWPLVTLIACLKARQRAIRLEAGQRVELGFLLVAGLYSLVIPLKGHIDLFDCVVLVGLFIVYTWRISKADVHEPELVGPAALIGGFPRGRRIAIVVTMLLGAAAVIFLVAEPFAEALIHTGTRIGVDEVFMVQWFAPIASEAPEIIVTVLFALRGFGANGLGALVASKVNQWTLLVGTLPLVFLFGSMGKLAQLPLHGKVPNLKGVVEEYDLIGPMFVTSGQTLFAAVIVLGLRAGYVGAGLLFGLLVAQFIVPDYMFIGTYNLETQWVFGGIYIVLALIVAVMRRNEFGPTLRAMVSPAAVRNSQHAAAID